MVRFPCYRKQQLTTAKNENFSLLPCFSIQWNQNWAHNKSAQEANGAFPPFFIHWEKTVVYRPIFLYKLTGESDVLVQGSEHLLAAYFFYLSWILLIYKKITFLLSYSSHDSVVTRKYCALLSLSLKIPSQIEKAGTWVCGTLQMFAQFFIHLFSQHSTSLIRNRKLQSRAHPLIQ